MDMNLMKFIIHGIAKTKYALKYKLNYILNYLSLTKTNQIKIMNICSMFTCVSWASVNGVTCGTWTGMWNAGTPLKGITGGAINGTLTGMLTGVTTGRPMGGGALTGTAAGPGEGWWSWPWPAKTMGLINWGAAVVSIGGAGCCCFAAAVTDA